MCERKVYLRRRKTRGQQMAPGSDVSRKEIKRRNRIRAYFSNLNFSHCIVSALTKSKLSPPPIDTRNLRSVTAFAGLLGMNRIFSKWLMDRKDEGWVG
ncbi:hypothetical protein EVAR_59858_1 [Eumeta japonica]|uniref:Uncharacterized protein n=1 Tax=Eumeta variegata TaxID=151549 RepID=A0A4C1Z914_EUMVA|nr:hypothetical protein EVAR_59858_1 [Eumeta japonica]